MKTVRVHPRECRGCSRSWTPLLPQTHYCSDACRARGRRNHARALLSARTLSEREIQRLRFSRNPWIRRLLATLDERDLDLRRLRAVITSLTRGGQHAA